VENHLEAEHDKDINKNNKSNLLWKFAGQDPKLQPYLKAFSDREIKLLQDPRHYLGHSIEKTEIITEHWRQKLARIKHHIQDIQK